MEANELMIGDFLRYKQGFPDTHLQGKIVEVCGIDGRVDVRTINDGKFHDSEHPNWLEPIPITPEILERNGWKHKYYGIYRQTIGETITIDIFPGGCSVEDERGSQCFYRLRYHLPALKFVHELQHALRLCGIEKEIEL